MAKQKPVVTVRTHGIYSHWDSESKDLPSFLEQATIIPARIDIEFGLLVNIRGGKNLPLECCIDHPGILDEHGKRRPPFEDVVYVKSNDWDFYLGDTIWEPIADKLGIWRMTLTLQNQIVADQTFEVCREPTSVQVDSTPRHRYRLIWVDGLLS